MHIVFSTKLTRTIFTRVRNNNTTVVDGVTSSAVVVNRPVKTNTIRLSKVVGILAIASVVRKSSNAHDERFRVDGPGQHDAAVVQSHVPGAVRAPNAQAQASVQDAPRGARPEKQVPDGRSVQTTQSRE